MVEEPVIFISNPLFDLAEKFVLQTSRSLFLTGKAGTGKTTFLRRIKSTTSKNTVVVAPTGVAAINAGGTTIHSFFQLPFTPFIPRNKGAYDSRLADRYSLLQNLRIEKEKREIFRALDLLIIDEVSMVRCDVLDSIDIVLRHFRRREDLPFGGVQLVFIGDLFQLPPVAQPSEWSILRDYYQSPFFFDALVMKELQPLYIELKTIFRQRDENFIGILNRVRSNEVTNEDLKVLNDRFDPGFQPREMKYVILTTHNDKADRINTQKLLELTDTARAFQASVEGEFPERIFPTDRNLTLKKGAQIMFVKNDVERVRRYYNGKIGTISRIGEEGIFVEFEGEEGELELVKDSWRNMRYTLNTTTGAIEEEVLGMFTQYPVRLAWAITIHKSQGLTFRHAIIDAGSSFASGQVYVALSRCTTLEGLVLRSTISRSAVITDQRILEFASREMSESRLRPLLEVERQQYIAETVLKIFDLEVLQNAFVEFREFVDGRKTVDKDEAWELLDKLESKSTELTEVGEKFAFQLRHLVIQQDYDSARKRVAQATDYFREQLVKELLGPLEDHKASVAKKKKVRRYLKELSSLISVVNGVRDVLLRTKDLAERIGTT